MSDPRPLPPIEPLTRSTRGVRQPYLTESEFREHLTNDGRRRVEQNVDANARGPTASSYSNRTPTQQSVYDWAAHEPSDSDSDDEIPTFTYRRAETSIRRDVQEYGRRRLPWPADDHRQLRNQVQRDLEPRDEPSGRLLLPSMEHLRRSVQDLPEILGNGSTERLAAPRSPSVTAALSRLIERQRLERRERTLERREGPEWPGTVSYREPDPITDDERTRLRQHLSDLRRRERAADPDGSNEEASVAQVRRRLLDVRRRERLMQRLDKHRIHRPSMPKTVTMLKYLSDLRDCDDQVEVFNLVGQLGMFDEEPSKDAKLSSMLLDPHQLNPVSPSSFLSPGTRFTGVQRAAQDLPSSLLSRDRDYLRRMVATRNAANTIEDLAAEDLIVALSDGYRSFTQPGSRQEQVQARLDRLRQSRQQSGGLQGSSSRTQTPPTEPLKDSWPVSVTLHTISLQPQNMTVSGTMSASHIPDKISPTSPDHNPEGSSMSSFFEGEIIDFAHHTLETNCRSGDSTRPRFPNCGIEVDARYWAGIGPLKVVADEARKKRSEMTRRARMARDAAAEVAGDAEKEDEEAERLIEEKMVDDAVAGCLADREWLESKVGGCGEWVLMRWKERCFISPPDSTTPSSSTPQSDPAIHGLSASTAEYHQQQRAANPTPTLTTTTSGCVGLTISGFYYIALHRLSGRVEGLYFDPGSQPFQELRLGVDSVSGMGVDAEAGGRKRCFPSVEFR